MAALGTSYCEGHGYCLGSALEITLACDVTISTPDCFFGEPEVKHGDGIICLILPWIISVKAAKENRYCYNQH